MLPKDFVRILIISISLGNQLNGVRCLSPATTTPEPPVHAIRIENYRGSFSSRALKSLSTAERPSRPRPFAFGSEDICTREASSRGQKNDLYTAVKNVHVMTKDGKTDAHVAVQECTFMQSYIHVCTCG